jgi:hypothetical protein
MGNRCGGIRSYKAQEDESAPLQPLGDPIHQGSILGITFDSQSEHDGGGNSGPHGRGQGRVITCSDDKRIGIMGEDYFTMGPSIDRRVAMLEGHSKAVNRMCVRGDMLYSVSRDLSLRQASFSSFPNILKVVSNCLFM